MSVNLSVALWNSFQCVCVMLTELMENGVVWLSRNIWKNWKQLPKLFFLGKQKPYGLKPTNNGRIYCCVKSSKVDLLNDVMNL